jgi:hypothetical protein
MTVSDATQAVLSSAQLAARIEASDFSHASATVVGYGNMGREYVKALRALGVPRIRVCTRSVERLAELRGHHDIMTVAGGYRCLKGEPDKDELAIVAAPVADLIDATIHLVNCGYRRILIEKPVSLWADQIEKCAAELERAGVDAACAYNRLAYPSFQEVRARVREEGGITSCTYTFTEFIDRIGPEHFTADELRRWGIANSLHVISMAHGLIGLPETWSGQRSGALSWHPAGAVFVGSGISSQRIPFAYHADWGSAGRWSVEVHTRSASYRLCPLETLVWKSKPTHDWEPAPVTIWAPAIKAGFAEQVGTMLMEPSARMIAMPGLREVARLTAYAEQLFGYAES